MNTSSTLIKATNATAPGTTATTTSSTLIASTTSTVEEVVVLLIEDESFGDIADESTTPVATSSITSTSKSSTKHIDVDVIDDGQVMTNSGYGPVTTTILNNFTETFNIPVYDSAEEVEHVDDNDDDDSSSSIPSPLQLKKGPDSVDIVARSRESIRKIATKPTLEYVVASRGELKNLSACLKIQFQFHFN